MMIEIKVNTSMATQPEVVPVGGIEVMAFSNMAALVNYVIQDDGTVFSGSIQMINTIMIENGRVSQKYRPFKFLGN